MLSFSWSNMVTSSLLAKSQRNIVPKDCRSLSIDVNENKVVVVQDTLVQGTKAQSPEGAGP